MKLALNGALTIVTMDGANNEICEAVGRENLFVFGLTGPQAAGLRASGYRPRDVYESAPLLRRAIDLVRGGGLSPEEPGRCAGPMDGLLAHDPYPVLAELADYPMAQSEVDLGFRDHSDWAHRLGAPIHPERGADRALLRRPLGGGLSAGGLGHGPESLMSMGAVSGEFGAGLGP